MSMLMTTLLGIALLASSPAVVDDLQDGVVERQAVTTNPADELIDTLGRDGLGGLRKLWSQIGVASDMFEGDEDDVQLVIFRFAAELNGNTGDEVLLRITDSDENDFHYLALSHDGESWSSVGFVDLWNQRLDSQTHRIATLAEDQRWLVIRSLNGNGSGFSKYQETWYQPKDGNLVNVLGYPVDGHVSGHSMPFDRNFKGTQTGLAKRDFS